MLCQQNIFYKQTNSIIFCLNKAKYECSLCGLYLCIDCAFITCPICSVFVSCIPCGHKYTPYGDYNMDTCPECLSNYNYSTDYTSTSDDLESDLE